MAATVRVEGLRELQAALRKAEGDLDKGLRKSLLEAGRVVREEATGLFSSVDGRSAAGYRVRVRGRGVAVEQSLSRTTGQHAQYGALQMRTALVPALDSKHDEVIEKVDEMLGQIARGF